MSRRFQGDLSAALADELASTVGRLLNSPATVGSSPNTAGTSGRRWSVRVDVAGPATGWISLVFSHEAAAAMAERLSSASTGAIDDVVVAELRNVCETVVAGVAARPISQGARLLVVRVHEDSQPAVGVDPALYAITLPALPVPIDVAIRCAVTDEDDVPGDRLDVIMDIDLPVVVRFGRTDLSLGVLTRLGPGSVIDLGRAPDDPVDILVSNRVIARGEVVVVGGNYGVRVLDVVSPAERLRSVEV